MPGRQDESRRALEQLLNKLVQIKHDEDQLICFFQDVLSWQKAIGSITMAGHHNDLAMA
jgi:hypothetical protein